MIAAALASLVLAAIPAPAATVVQAPCPVIGGPCAFPDGRVYLPTGSPRFAREHELGHVFDAQRLDDGERNKLKRLLALPGRPWRLGTGLHGAGSPSERFADAYAACRMHLDPAKRWAGSYDYNPSRRGFVRTCATIARAAD